MSINATPLAVESLFYDIDNNHSGEIDFKELDAFLRRGKNIVAKKEKSKARKGLESAIDMASLMGAAKGGDGAPKKKPNAFQMAKLKGLGAGS